MSPGSKGGARRAALAVVALVGAIALAAAYLAGWLGPRGEGSRGEPGRAGSSGAGPAGAGAASAGGRDGAGAPRAASSGTAAAGTGTATASRADTLLADLAKAMAGGDRPALLAAARALRAALVADPGGIAAAARALRDPSLSRDVRAAIAAVLGSLPGEAGKAAVLEALAAGALAGLERAAILSLGILEAEDGDFFEREGQPFALEIAPGISTYVRGPIASAAARAEIARRLDDAADAAERLAGARALHDSTGAPEVREALERRIRGDSDPEVAGEAGAALCEWTRSDGIDEAERAAVISTVLEVAPRSGEVVQFRITGPLSTAMLSAEERDRLHTLAAGAADEDARRFAIEVVGRRLAPRRPESDPGLPVLVQALATDPSGDVREAAAMALARATSDAAVVATLGNALRRDSDWEVRAAAAAALGRAHGSDAARAALEAAAAGDPSPDVRAVAENALAALGGAPARPVR